MARYLMARYKDWTTWVPGKTTSKEQDIKRKKALVDDFFEVAKTHGIQFAIRTTGLRVMDVEKYQKEIDAFEWGLGLAKPDNQLDLFKAGHDDKK